MCDTAGRCFCVNLRYDVSGPKVREQDANIRMDLKELKTVKFNIAFMRRDTILNAYLDGGQ